MDTRSSLGVYTTIYPAVRGYLADWHRSLRAQTDKGFELWIGLDAIDAKEVQEIIGSEVDAHWLRAPEGSTPGEIRQMALSRMVVTHAGVVLVDSDDLLEPTRVEAARDQLDRCELGGCALRLVDERGDDLNLTFRLPDQLDPEDVFPRWNVFGFSNSAFRSSLLRRCLPIPRDAVLVDWFLATRAWLMGSEIDFDRVPRMKYRQYPGTMAHVRLPFSTHQVFSHTEAVRRHFRLALVELPADYIEERYEALVNVQRDIEHFWQRVVHEKAKLESYVQALNALTPIPIWWTSVAYPSLRTMWS